MISAPLAPYLAFVRRHRRTYLVALCVAAVATATYSFTTEKKYTASVTTIVPYREVEVDLRMGQGRAFPVQYSFVVNNHLEVARSTAVHEELLARLRAEHNDLLQDLVRPEILRRGDAATVRALAARLRVTSRNETGILRIDASAPTAEGAATLANLTLDAYAEVQQRVNQRSVREWQTYLEQEELRWSKELDDREQRLESFRERESVANLIEETRLLLEQVLRLDAERASVQGERASLQARWKLRAEQLESLRQRLAHEMRDSGPQLVAELRNQIARDEAWYDYLLAGGADSTGVEIAALRHRVSLAKQSLAEHSSALLADSTLGEDPLALAGNLLGTIRDIEVDVVAREARLAQLREGIGLLRQRLDQLPSLNRLQSALQRDLALVEDIYKTVHQRLLEANVDARRSEGRMHAVNPAVPPRSPTSPVLVLALAGGLLLALIAGTVAAAAVEAVDPTVRDAEDAAALAQAPALCRPAREGGGTVSAPAAAAWALCRVVAPGARAWLVEPDGGGDPHLAEQVAERLTQLGVPARTVEPGREIPAPTGSAWIGVVGLDLLLSADGLGRGAAAVLLVVRPGKTRRAAVADAAALLRGSGVRLPGILVV